MYKTSQVVIFEKTNCLEIKLHSFSFLHQLCPTHGPHAAQSKVLCGPVTFPLQYK